jgi:excisionase family DNA binding protein
MSSLDPISPISPFPPNAQRPPRRDLLPEQPLFFSIPYAAALLGISTRTVRRNIRSGALSAVRIGNRGAYRIPRTSLTDFLHQEVDQRSTDAALVDFINLNTEG